VRQIPPLPIVILLLAVKPITVAPSTNISSKNNAHQHHPKVNVSTSLFLFQLKEKTEEG
jgi:hypothetical protein